MIRWTACRLPCSGLRVAQRPIPPCTLVCVSVIVGVLMRAGGNCADVGTIGDPPPAPGIWRLRGTAGDDWSWLQLWPIVSTLREWDQSLDGLLVGVDPDTTDCMCAQGSA